MKNRLVRKPSAIESGQIKNTEEGKMFGGNGGFDNCLLILLLLCCCGGCGGHRDGFGENGCGCGDRGGFECCDIIWLILLLSCCGGGRGGRCCK